MSYVPVTVESDRKEKKILFFNADSSYGLGAGRSGPSQCTLNNTKSAQHVFPKFRVML